ncbi:Ciliary BBSome complex subunit 2 N-inal/Ciliary BBSome complex subunit 2 middle region/Ciliary BBSome complex subunit 2 C-inal [Leishmania donovani]|uniref:Ciliary BBSome complex subunit 2, C-terminal family protein n=2 Tax=Leishmania donovani TaxID=5661 RepID=A0A504X340_LEIDO|nr:Ciliary BBSome complex subunit 2, C-terminal family protein [Leishmania donovani]CAJ1990843.1 Ciliary BBSome complex subunit 2 N-inal/Ciliary BBSome complex subunit 2 middle region/Ciliary BBSome complex subunit 2 C-inal [Leishmania donovani]
MATAKDASNHIRLDTAFELNIGAPILPDRVAAGRFLRSAAAREASASAQTLAVRPPPSAVSLAFGSSGQRILLHNNNTSTAKAKRSAKRGEAQASVGVTFRLEDDESVIQTLNFGKAPTALAAGQLYDTWSTDIAATYDVLLFGAATSLLAYDAEQNKQVFYKDVEDGVQAVVCGTVMKPSSTSGEAPPLAVVGGNCSIFGFDRFGAERYWTVTGDQVTAMALMPWTSVPDSGSAPLSLLVASDDFEVRVYDGEEAIATVHEVDRVQKLVPLWQPSRIPDTEAAAADSAGRYAYLLENGTVGMYERGERVWRVRGKSVPVSAAFCDVDGDGVAELVIGWSNGRVEVRTDRGGGLEKGGSVLFRDTYSSAVAAVLSEDYRQDGMPLPVICTVDGTVRGLALLETRKDEAAEVRQLQVLEALVQEKQQLAAQLTSLEEQLARRAAGAQDTTMPESGVEVRCCCSANLATKHVEVRVEVTGPAAKRGDIVVHSCLLQCEVWATAAQQDTVAFANAEPSATLVCSFAHPDDLPLNVSASVAVGPAFGDSYQIHEVTVRVPRFMMYQLPYKIPPEQQRQRQGETVAYRPPNGCVLLQWRELLHLDVIERWLRHSFCVPEDVALLDANAPTDQVLHLELIHVRDGSSFGIEVRNAAASGAAFNTITLWSDHLAPCGAVINAFVEDLKGGWADGKADPVAVRCEMPLELERLRAIFARVDEFNEVRMKLTTDMADAATVVKTLLGRAEDARLLGDMASMKKSYAALYDVDQELLCENAKRINNYEELKLALKEVNTCIQQAGMVRIGPARAQLIASCRNALKENQVNSLLEIIRTGSE